MKTLFWMIAMGMAWLLTAGFAWQYSTNVHTIEYMKEQHDHWQRRLEDVRAEREALESEAIAIESDPFYTERLLRERLGWVRTDDSSSEPPPASPDDNPSRGRRLPRPEAPPDHVLLVSDDNPETDDSAHQLVSSNERLTPRR